MQAVATPAQIWAKPSASTAPRKTADMQRIGTRCWRTLITKGVPSEDARELAIAIIHFIYLGNQPSSYQKDLLGRYYQHICAANIPALQLA